MKTHYLIEVCYTSRKTYFKIPKKRTGSKRMQFSFCFYRFEKTKRKEYKQTPPFGRGGMSEWSAVHQQNRLPLNRGKLFLLVAAIGGDLGRFAARATRSKQTREQRKKLTVICFGLFKAKVSSISFPISRCFPCRSICLFSFSPFLPSR